MWGLSYILTCFITLTRKSRHVDKFFVTGTELPVQLVTKISLKRRFLFRVLRLHLVGHIGRPIIRQCYTSGLVLDFTYQSHYSDVIMIAMASQITSLTIVYSTDYSGADQRKHQSSASLAFVTGEFPAQRASNAENVAWCRQAASHYLNQCWPSGTTLFHNELTCNFSVQIISNVGNVSQWMPSSWSLFLFEEGIACLGYKYMSVRQCIIMRWTHPAMDCSRCP